MTFIHRIAYPLALLSLLTVISAPLWAKCTDPSNAPRFTYGRKGDMICDRVAGAVWMRCTYGQNWSAATNKCEGFPYRARGPEVDELLKMALAHGWQLPTKAQLAAIFDGSQNFPKIDLGAFPDTPPGSFWTTEALALWRENKPTAFSMIDFSAGASKESLMPAGTGYYVRLLLIPGSVAATSAGIHTD